MGYLKDNSKHKCADKANDEDEEKEEEETVSDYSNNSNNEKSSISRIVNTSHFYLKQRLSIELEEFFDEFST